MPEKTKELVRFCQECSFHCNRPGRCSVKKCWMARKELNCDSFKLKKRLK